MSAFHLSALISIVYYWQASENNNNYGDPVSENNNLLPLTTVFK